GGRVRALRADPRDRSVGAPEHGGGGPQRMGAGGARSGGEEDCERGGGDGIRSEPRAADQGQGREAGGGGARGALHYASYRERRMVDGSADRGGVRALRGDQ